MQTVLKSRSLIDELTKRASAIASKSVAARIVVPPEMSWWYYQEFGTTGPYQIPLAGSEFPDGPMLKLPPKGNFSLYHVSVMHPGVSPKLYITEIQPSILEVSAYLLARGLVQGGYSSAYCAEVLEAQVMPTVRDMIAENMRNYVHADPDNPSGQLKGQDPADVFTEDSSIVMTEE